MDDFKDKLAEAFHRHVDPALQRVRTLEAQANTVRKRITTERQRVDRLGRHKADLAGKSFHGRLSHIAIQRVDKP